jgi:dienelactone hydrolase
MIRERVARFGKGLGLVGIYTDGPNVTPELPPWVILNAGILHRVGPNRLHAVLARRMARQGHATLRFDFSGLGDSAVRSDARPFQESSLAELTAALDWLAKASDARSYVVAGMCSGADVAMRAGAVDERIEAVVLFDPQAYRTPRYYLNRLRPRLFRLSAWHGAFRARLRWPRQADSVAGNVDEGQPPLDMGNPVARRDATARLAAMAARGVQIYAMFSGGQGDYYSYRGQYGEAFSSSTLRESLDENYIAEADHIFSNPAHQRTLVESVSRWASARWPRR